MDNVILISFLSVVANKSEFRNVPERKQFEFEINLKTRCPMIKKKLFLKEMD